MGRIFGILSMMASIIALSSLIYGAFHEPLYPYMQGVVGGVMDVYRLIRDYIFTGLGLAFSGVINFIGQWLTWLPPAPWFTILPWLKDFISLYLIFGGAFFAWFYRTAVHARLKELERILGRHYLLAVLSNPKLIGATITDALWIMVLFPIWPIILIQIFDWAMRPAKYVGNYKGEEIRNGEKVRVYEGYPDNWLFIIPGFGDRWMIEAFLRSKSVVRFTLANILRLVVGAVIYFALVYAENQIGL